MEDKVLRREGVLALQTLEYLGVLSHAQSVTFLPVIYWVFTVPLILTTGGFHSPFISLTWQTWTIALSSFPGTDGRPQMLLVGSILLISYAFILFSHFHWVIVPQFPFPDPVHFYMHCFCIARVTFSSWIRGANFRSFISNTIATERGSSEAKSTFLANISHGTHIARILRVPSLMTTLEMRTPLTSIIGASDLILHGGPSAMSMEYIVMIKQSGEQVLSIVNDLLDVSSIDRGKFKLHRIAFNVYDIVMQIANSHRKTLSPAVEFKSNIKIGEDLVVLGDMHRLSQVIHKLLSNASKFTKEGEIFLSCEVINRGGNEAVIEFIVRDTGIGMSESVKHGLFQPFFQADKSSTRRFGGVGLGLTICQELVAAMGGALSCVSIEGVGSTFKFTVSLELSSRKVIREDGGFDSSESSAREDFPTTWYDTNVIPNVSSPPAVLQSLQNDSGSKPTILIVEDNLFNQQLLKKILNLTSTDVDTADNGEEALMKAERKNYDLIFMDIQMPIRDGIDATKAIRKKDKNVHIVGLTANCDEQSRVRAMHAGMNSLLFKPVRVDDLQDIVNKTARRNSI